MVITRVPKCLAHVIFSCFTNENMPPQITKRACEQQGLEEQNSSQAPLRKVFRKTLSKILRACEKSFSKIYLAKQILEFGNADVIEISVKEGYYGARGHKFAFLFIFGNKGE